MEGIIAVVIVIAVVVFFATKKTKKRAPAVNPVLTDKEIQEATDKAENSSNLDK